VLLWDGASNIKILKTLCVAQHTVDQPISILRTAKLPVTRWKRLEAGRRATSEDGIARSAAWQHRRCLNLTSQGYQSSAEYDGWRLCHGTMASRKLASAQYLRAL
jgi:hypothetical protein